jgi:hypothetical protein
MRPTGIDIIIKVRYYHITFVYVKKNPDNYKGFPQQNIKKCESLLFYKDLNIIFKRG